MQNDAVRIMTIHGAKGLQSKVVILADVFSGRQTNLMNENKNKMIVTPEMFGGRPKPWPIKKSGKDHPHSPLWKHLMRTHIARKDAESRRLLYVAATRAESKLIITGSPKETEWREGEGLVVPWAYSSPIPQLGQMWLESLRQGSWRRDEEESHWMSGDDSESEEEPPVSKKGERIFDPMKALTEGFLGSVNLPGLTLIHHPDCLDDPDNGTEPLLTPLQMIEMVDDAARESSKNPVPPMPTPRWNISSRVRVAPHRLSTLQNCRRRYWLETRGGMAIEQPTNNSKLESEVGLPQGIDAAAFGKIVHRAFEIGLGNPGPPDGENADLPDSWAAAGEDKLDDPAVIVQVLDELLPSDADREGCISLMDKMLSRIKEGVMGDLVSGKDVNGHIVEGLRTEMPFHLSRRAHLDRVVRTRWTPDGPEPLSAIDEANVEMDGVIDLVLCTVSGDGKHIRPIDLKTEEAHKLTSGSSDGLMESHGNHSFEPQCDAEIEMLENHSMQLALYYLALRTIEEERGKRGLPNRTVLRPAILVGVTGRIVEYPEEMFNATLSELDKSLSLAASMSLESEPIISDYECSCGNCPQ